MNYPVLFLPMFTVSLVSSVMSSDVVLSVLGNQFGLWFNLLILLALAPPAMGMTIILDRQICSEGNVNLNKAFVTISAAYFPLVGVNLTSWLIIMVGFFFFIIPGIFLLVKFIMINQSFLIGDGQTIEEILRESWSVTGGHLMELFGLIIVLVSPLLLLELFFYRIPPGILATIQVTLGTALQTWLVITMTHVFLDFKESSKKKEE